MSSFRKWDRDGYIERAGGAEQAEERRKALMARQSGYRLAEERKRHGLTQAQLAKAMAVTPGRVSQIERGEVATIDAIARYIEALGWAARPGRYLRRPHPDGRYQRSGVTAPRPPANSQPIQDRWSDTQPGIYVRSQQ